MSYVTRSVGQLPMLQNNTLTNKSLWTWLSLKREPSSLKIVTWFASGIWTKRDAMLIPPVWNCYPHFPWPRWYFDSMMEGLACSKIIFRGVRPISLVSFLWDPFFSFEFLSPMATFQRSHSFIHWNPLSHSFDCLAFNSFGIWISFQKSPWRIHQCHIMEMAVFFFSFHGALLYSHFWYPTLDWNWIFPSWVAKIIPLPKKTSCKILKNEFIKIDDKVLHCLKGGGEICALGCMWMKKLNAQFFQWDNGQLAWQMKIKFSRWGGNEEVLSVKLKHVSRRMQKCVSFIFYGTIC